MATISPREDTFYGTAIILPEQLLDISIQQAWSVQRGHLNPAA